MKYVINSKYIKGNLYLYEEDKRAVAKFFRENPEAKDLLDDNKLDELYDVWFFKHPGDTRSESLLTTVLLVSGIEILDHLTKIPCRCFIDLSQLESVVIPNNIKVIGDMAFGHNTWLEKIIIPNSIEEIESWAFFDCPSLRDGVTIPASVQFMGEGVFGYCNSLGTIHCEAEEKPFGWHVHWKGHNPAEVVWDCK